MQTLGEESILKGLVLPALNKLPNIKADLVRTDEEWEMENLIKALQKWLKRNQPEAAKDHGDRRRERHMFAQKGDGENPPFTGLRFVSLQRITLGALMPCIYRAGKALLILFRALPMADRDTEKINVVEKVVTSARQGITPACVKTSRKNEDRNNGKMLTGFSPSKEESLFQLSSQ